MTDVSPTPAATVPIPLGETTRPGRGRSAAAVISFVLAAALTIPTAVGYWGHRTLTDTQRYLATVAPLVNSPEVRDAVSTAVVDAIQSQVDVEAILNDAFSGVITDRPRLQLLVGPVSAGIDGLIDREVRSFVASDTFEQLWLAANTRAQQALVRILEGDSSGAISLQNGQLVLDLSDVIQQVKDRLVARGLTMLENLPLPSIDRTIVLLDAPQLQTMRNIYAFAQPLATWSLLAVGLLYLAALVLARRRARMALAIGIALVINGVLAAFVLSVGRQLFVNQLSGTVFGPASSVFYETLLQYLDRGVRTVTRIGLVIVAAGWFAGSSVPATRLRRAVSTGLHRLGSTARSEHAAGAGRWVTPNAAWLRWVIVAVGATVLGWGLDTSPGRLSWSVLLVLVLLCLLEILIGAADQRTPGDDTAASLPTEAATMEG